MDRVRVAKHKRGKRKKKRETQNNCYSHISNKGQQKKAPKKNKVIEKKTNSKSDKDKNGGGKNTHPKNTAKHLTDVEQQQQKNARLFFWQYLPACLQGKI